MFRQVHLDPAAKGPLHGIRVLDLSRLVAGNTLTMALADLGADVLKVEPIAGDTLREWRVEDVETTWKAYSRNKRSLSLNLWAPEMRPILLALVRQATVLVESFRPGTLEKMDLAPSLLLAENPNLVITRISGWGQTGPYADRPGFGTLVEGVSGFASMNGFPDREPVLPPIYLGDMTAGLFGAIGILAAVRAIEVGDQAGQVIDLPLLDPLFAILGPQAANYRLTHRPKPRTGSRSTNSAPRNVYRTEDNKWVCLSASTQNMAERLFRAMGHADLLADDKFRTNAARLLNVEELDSILQTFIGARSRTECLALFNAASVTVAPVYDIADIEVDPHYHQRDIVVELPDRTMGTTPVHNISPRLSATPGSFRCAAPELGEHTETVLRDLGYAPETIDQLEAKGVIRRFVESPS